MEGSFLSFLCLWDSIKFVSVCGFAVGFYRKASEEAPTSNEILQLAAEQDGTVGAAEADEQKRVKDENWAVYTEENAKGAGNTMNRFVFYFLFWTVFGNEGART